MEDMFWPMAKHQSELDYIINYILTYGGSGSIPLEPLDNFSKEDLAYIERELRKCGYCVRLTMSR